MFMRRLFLSFCLVLLPAQTAFAQTVNPQGSGPIISALSWMQGTLLGNVATAVAVMAVAAVGFMMLTGRMNWRFGATPTVRLQTEPPSAGFRSSHHAAMMLLGSAAFGMAALVNAVAAPLPSRRKPFDEIDAVVWDTP